MKLKELFDKYTFDEILPFLKAIEPERGDSLYQFREALDLLKHMEPSESSGLRMNMMKTNIFQCILLKESAGMLAWPKKLLFQKNSILMKRMLLHIVYGRLHFGGSKMSMPLRMEALSTFPQSKEINMTKHSIEFSLAIGSISPLADIDPKLSHSVLMLISV